MQVLNENINGKKAMGYHFVLLRQLLEIISSFLGTGGIKKALESIGYKDDLEKVSNQVNALSHKDARQQPAELNPEDVGLLEEIYQNIQTKYEFIVH
tara:strand:- start:211 stop:501 length:291 start_codon:yes stop_codon:yes gene_type:complete